MANVSTYYFKQALREFGDEYVKELIKQLVLADKKATGQLIHSISYKLVEASNELLLHILANGYLKYVDEGIGPAAGKSKLKKMPPVNKIIKWAQIRNISPKPPKYKTINQVGWAIAKKIQKEGIKPTHVLDKARNNLFSNKALIDKLSRGSLLDLNDVINKALGNLSEASTPK